MTTSRGRWSLFGVLLMACMSAQTNAQTTNHDFLLHPVDTPVAVFAGEFEHAVGSVLNTTSAPTQGVPAGTPWMGSNTFRVADDAIFGTGNVATRTVPGDYSGSGSVEQGDLDNVLLSWGEPGVPPPSGWVDQLPQGMIGQEHLDAVLLNWGNGDGGVLTCLPWEIDPNEDGFFSVQAEVWIPEKSNEANVSNKVAIGYFDNTNADPNSPDHEANFEEGRGALWMELYYTEDQEVGSHEAHYRVRAKDTGGIVDLFDSADTQETVDLSGGFATMELAWKTSSNLAWRMFGAAVVDSDGNTKYVEAADGEISGPLSGLDNQGGFFTHGVGFELDGAGGMVGSFHAVPEPSTLVLLSVTAFAIAVTRLRRKRC